MVQIEREILEGSHGPMPKAAFGHYLCLIFKI